MNRMDDAAEAMAKAILRCDNMRVISHNDADGITSAGLMCHALSRSGIPFHATLVQRLDEAVIASVQGPVAFCDMGSGQPELISRIKGEVFVLDHHRPVGTLSCMTINPHNFGIDGAFELSASGTTYSVVRKMGDNVDLAGLALVGAMGDRQGMTGANRSIYQEAIRSGVIEVRPGLKMAMDGDVAEVFLGSIEPLLDFTGDLPMVKTFLNEVGVSAQVQDLEGKDLVRLATALVLKMLMQGSFAADSIVGETVRLKREVVDNAFEMVLLLNACGKLEKAGLGLTLCLRDDGVLSPCRALAAQYKEELMTGLKILRRDVKEMENIRYLMAKDLQAGGVVAGLGIRYLFTDMPLLVLNHKDGLVKVSARGNKPLVRQGLDLSVALRRAAEAVGGRGGGHTIASGASIPPGSEDKFLRTVDQVVGEQIPTRRGP